MSLLGDKDTPGVTAATSAEEEPPLRSETPHCRHFAGARLSHSVHRVLQFFKLAFEIHVLKLMTVHMRF